MNLRSYLQNRAQWLQQEASHALSFPWTWPVEDDLVRSAEALGHSKPAGPEPGEVLVVTVGLDSQKNCIRSSLWCLRRWAGPIPEHLHSPALGEKASSTLESAILLATRDLKVLRDLNALRTAGKWRVVLITAEGEGIDIGIDGPSADLPIVLANASLGLGIPVPSDVIATAEVQADGKLKKVGGLPDKVAVIRAAGLGIRRLVVAHEQAVEAEKLCKGSGIGVVGVHSVSDAFAKVFLNSDGLELWPDQETATQAATELFHLALDGKVERVSMLDWHCVRRAADMLRNLLADDDVRSLAGFAVAVAERHDGVSPPSRPCVTAGAWAKLFPADRLKCKAHEVQWAVDASSPDLDKEIASLGSLLQGDLSGSEAELRLVGAMGRGLAGLRRYEEARELLRKTVDAWVYGVRRPAESSYALSELVRVLGVLIWQKKANMSDLEAVMNGPTRAFESNHDAMNDNLAKGFVKLALGRALVTAGDCAAAIPHLDKGADWDKTPGHVRLARHRWYALALDGVGRQAEAVKVRDQLCTGLGAAIGDVFPVEPDDGNDRLDKIDEALFEMLLGMLDLAHQQKETDYAERIAGWIVRLDSQAVRGLLADGPTGWERVERLLMEHPY